MHIRGHVFSFDGSRGDGVIVTDLGESLYFHCVTIADGTRTISLGAEINARRSVGHLGLDEAIDVRVN